MGAGEIQALFLRERENRHIRGVHLRLAPELLRLQFTNEHGGDQRCERLKEYSPDRPRYERVPEDEIVRIEMPFAEVDGLYQPKTARLDNPPSAIVDARGKNAARLGRKHDIAVASR